MKLHYSKILLFVFPLNILLTLYHAHNKNKLYITPHHTQTNRSLCEGDTQSSNYDKDADMKNVKESFDRQTSQRFEQYEERIQEKRQKRKEERDKNIKEIIEKDKMDKLLAEKIEKGCLKCGCGLGGVAASVGIFGTVAVKELAKSATAAAVAQEAVKDGAMAATIKAAGAEAGKKFVIEELQKWGISTLGHQSLVTYFTTRDYTKASLIYNAIRVEYQPSSCAIGGSGTHQAFCTWVLEKSAAARNVQRSSVSTNALVETTVNEIVAKATDHAAQVTKTATEDVIQSSTLLVEAKYATCQTAIIASVVALLIIVLVMIIIYLVLRNRRKKKMNKKAQYTKLLNQ
ncbi:rifin [Plasmodium reichenowi]|uniref:Rifin n=1 Tax=Plasmodium reichenowi TaxID=5854 RepID=A0A060RMS1_PLARE|nr:rifin [Plasmodium reichenowi]